MPCSSQDVYELSTATACQRNEARTSLGVVETPGFSTSENSPGASTPLIHFPWMVMEGGQSEREVARDWASFNVDTYPHLLVLLALNS